MPKPVEHVIREAIALERDALRLKGLAFPVVTVRYRGPTDHRGSRWLARCGDTRYAIAYDYALDASDNAARAAWACWRRYWTAHTGPGWTDDEPRVFIPGDLNDSTYTYTVVPERFLT